MVGVLRGEGGEVGSHLLLPLAVEERIEVGGAGAGLQGQDAPTVLRQVEVLEHVKGLDNRRV